MRVRFLFTTAIIFGVCGEEATFTNEDEYSIHVGFEESLIRWPNGTVCYTSSTWLNNTAGFSLPCVDEEDGFYWNTRYTILKPGENLSITVNPSSKYTIRAGGLDTQALGLFNVQTGGLLRREPTPSERVSIAIGEEVDLTIPDGVKRVGISAAFTIGNGVRECSDRDTSVAQTCQRTTPSNDNEDNGASMPGSDVSSASVSAPDIVYASIEVFCAIVTLFAFGS